MKKIICLLIILFFCFNNAYSQTKKDTLNTRIFGFSPSNSNIDKVNGLVIGLGMAFGNGVDYRIVNGLNIEVNPLSIVFILYSRQRSVIGFDSTSGTVLNGINISTGSVPKKNDGLAINGISITLFNDSFSANGISVNGFFNYATNLNGVHLTLFSNYSKNANGIFVSCSNYSEKMNGIQFGMFNQALNSRGIQIGLFNKSKDFTGIQIGLFNKTSSLKGLQIGFWNSNKKRSLPFINF